MATREQLINQLREDNRGGVRLYKPAQRALIWSLVTWMAVLLPMLWVQAFRPEWVQQMLSSPRFAIETISGLVAIVLLGVLLFRLGTPGSTRRWLTISVVASAVIWIVSLAYGFIVPALDPSMAGKRDLCRYEVMVYALGPFLLAMYYLHRAYVLNWTLSAMVVGVSSALVPAWLMQIACLYDPQHTFESHLMPVVLVGLVAMIVGMLLQRKKPRNL